MFFVYSLTNTSSYQLGETARAIRPAVRLDQVFGCLAAGHFHPGTGNKLYPWTGVEQLILFQFLFH